jgi:outer membrane lipoprotein-sorting protein
MTRIITIILLSLSFILPTSYSVYAQGADVLLSKLSDRAKDYGSISATYSSMMVDVKNDFKESLLGNIQIDESKFMLDLGEYSIISDGVTVWTYEKETNDCYVEDADMLADQGMDPSRIFTIWEDDFKNSLEGVVEVSEQECVQVNLYPSGEDASEKPFHTIQLFINETLLEVKKIVVKGREGVDTEYLIQSFKTNVELPSSTFEFNEARFPGVTIIDNRI